MNKKSKINSFDRTFFGSYAGDVVTTSSMYKKILVALFAIIVVGGNGCNNSAANEGKNISSPSAIDATSSVSSVSTTIKEESLFLASPPKEWGKVSVSHEGPLDNGRRATYFFENKNITITQFSKDFTWGVGEGWCLCFNPKIVFPIKKSNLATITAYVHQAFAPNIPVIQPQMITLEKETPALLFYSEQSYAQHKVSAAIMVPYYDGENSLLVTVGLTPEREESYSDSEIAKAARDASGIVREVMNILNKIIISTPTITLVNRPVSEWPRYEFKELGFSMQLPFVSSSLSYGFGEHCYTQLSPCSTTNTIYSYTGVFKGEEDRKYMFIGSYSSNYQADRGSTIFDIENFSLTPEPKITFFYDSTLVIHPVYKRNQNGVAVAVFDVDKDFNSFRYAPGDMPLEDGKEWGIVFRLPRSKIFKAVLFSFYEEDFSLEKIKQIIPTIRFN